MVFTKMQGLGNDYLYVYGEAPEDVSSIARRLSDRHFGAGSDGMIYISPSETADFKMRIFNADGSEAMMCGNGIRCVGKYVYDRGYTDKTRLSIETLSGIRELRMQVSSGKVRSVTVDMGRVTVGEPAVLQAGELFVKGIRVSVGNPHFVIFTGDVEKVPLTAAGPLIEKDPLFPEGVNVEFVQVMDRQTLRMRVWERGSGVTLACGTGACASAAAAAAKGLCGSCAPITVLLDGGQLEISVEDDGTVFMTGPAEFVYDAEALL